MKRFEQVTANSIMTGGSKKTLHQRKLLLPPNPFFIKASSASSHSSSATKLDINQGEPVAGRLLKTGETAIIWF